MQDSPLPGADQLYEAAPCGLLIAAADGRILHANATLCGWLHCSPSQLAGGQRLHELLTMGGRIFYQTHLQPLLRMQGSVAEVKLELRRADGGTLPVMVNIAERAWQGQSLLHAAIFVAEDRHKYERELLLQRQRAQELAELHARDQQQLQAAQAQAEDRAQFAEQLVGVVSHDIRNPLSVIHMSALLLQRPGSPEQKAAALARVMRSVQRVQRLLGDLLDFTQARVGTGLGVRRSQVDLHQAVADGVAELAVAFPRARLQHVRSGPGQCVADAERVVQAVGNLVANAASHGAPGEPVTVRTVGDEDGFHVSVHNRGPAIPAAVLPRLFDPLVRGQDAGSKGVGLGLYIVREIARAHGGRVEAESSARDGTRFILHLPCG